MSRQKLNPNAPTFVPRRSGGPSSANPALEETKETVQLAHNAQSSADTKQDFEMDSDPEMKIASEYFETCMKTADVLAGPAIKNLPCPFYLKGGCKFGKDCKFSHPAESAPPVPLVPMPIYQDMDCNICYEKILTHGKKFGLLSHCDHPFCLECIRKWRGGYMKNVDKEFFRLCPVCRTESYFVIPSTEYITSGPEKDAIIEVYRKNLGKIPCKYLKQGDNFCPFGNSCFYAHLDKNGNKIVLPWRSKIIHADGREEFDQDLKLCDIIKLPPRSGQQ